MGEVLWLRRVPVPGSTSSPMRYATPVDPASTPTRTCGAGRSTTSTPSGRPCGRYFDVPSDGDPTTALADDAMPGAVWFPDVRLNYAEAMLRMPGRADDDVVVIARSQSRDEVRITAAELRDQVARARAGLVRFGVGPGDRVAAYAPNIPETLVLMLATASLGAVFSSCAPEFGVQSVIDRWQQIEPTLLLAVDGYRYGDKAIDRRAEVEAIRSRLPERPHRRLAAVPRRARHLRRRREDLGRPRVRSRRRWSSTRVPFDDAALRPVLVGHHRPAEADRARPRRHHRSSTSRCSACRATSGRPTGSSGSPRPAG